MKRIKRLVLAFLGLAALLPLSAPAADANPNAKAIGDFASGGVGSDDPLAALLENYNLQLVFAEKGTGAFLADVNVAIHDVAGRKLLEVASPAPRFFINLAPGRYRIAADFNGKTISKTVSVRELKRRDVYFYWDDAGE